MATQHVWQYEKVDRIRLNQLDNIIVEEIGHGKILQYGASDFIHHKEE